METSNASYYYKRMNTQLGIIKELGYTLNEQSVILELGCGSGNLVNAYRKKGYQAYGCDFNFRPDIVESFAEKGIIKKIRIDKYRLPFEDNSFDFLYSDQVFEHVIDYPTTLSEIKRVLKSDGISLHFFPSRYGAIEGHVKVPFASLIKKKYWLKIWAYLGIKNEFQKGLTAKEVATLNYSYLNNNTNYLTKSKIKRYCKRYFTCVRFCEKFFLKYSKRAHLLYSISKVIPLLPLLYSSQRARVLFFTNSQKNKT